MAILTSHYDKDIKKRVFEVRGDEAYAHTTDVTVSSSAITDMRIKGFKTTLTATVYRGGGASTVVFYDGDNVIGQKSLASGTSTATLSDVIFSWDYPHPVRVKYLGNSSCLASKSKILDLQHDMPDDLKIIITDSSTHQINGGASHTISATLSIDGEPITDDVSVLVYVDDELADTLTSDGSTVSGTISDISDGKHTIKLTVNDSTSFKGNSLSYTINVGYKVSITNYPSPYVTGATNTATVKVTTYDNTNVTSGTVTIGSYSGSLGSGGTATITLSSYISGEYYATYGGSQSQSVTSDEVTPTTITVTGDDFTVAKGNNETIYATVSGEDDSYSRVPIVFKKGSSASTSTTLTNDSGVAQYLYHGTGYGDNTITATIKGTNISDTEEIVDYLTWAKKGMGSYNFDWTLTKLSGSSGEFKTSLTNYYRIKATYSPTRLSERGFSTLFLNNIPNDTSPYNLTFKLNGISSGNYQGVHDIVVGMNTVSDSEISIKQYVSSTSTVSIDFTLTGATLKVDGTTKATVSYTTSTMKKPFIRVLCSEGAENSTVDISEFIVKKLS